MPLSISKYHHKNNKMYKVAKLIAFEIALVGISIISQHVIIMTYAKYCLPFNNMLFSTTYYCPLLLDWQVMLSKGSQFYASLFIGILTSYIGLLSPTTNAKKAGRK